MGIISWTVVIAVAIISFFVTKKSFVQKRVLAVFAVQIGLLMIWVIFVTWVVPTYISLRWQPLVGVVAGFCAYSATLNKPEIN